MPASVCRLRSTGPCRLSTTSREHASEPLECRIKSFAQRHTRRSIMSEVHTEGKQPMTVNLIEFYPPDGRQERITLKITDDQRDVVDELQAAGYTFTCEVLRTGDAVMYLTDPVVEDDAYVEVGSPKEIVAYADGLADKYKDQIN